MSSKQRIINIFNLPEDEIIFEDFSCALVDNILRHGRMFVGENYFCFYSTILGIQKKQLSNQLWINQNLIFKNILFIDLQKTRESLDTENLEASVVEDQTFDQQQVENAEVEVLNLEDNTGDSEKTEVMKIILPISVDTFFDYFYADNAGYSFSDHLIKNTGGQGMAVTNWVDNEEGNGKTREINCTIKVEGVPFKDRSRLYKVNTYQKDEKGGIQIKSMAKTLDVPYASNFQVEELWEIKPLEDDTQKCQLNVYCWVVIIKSFLWQNKAKTKGIEGVKKDVENWLKGAKKFLKEKNQKKKPNEAGNNQEYEKANELIFEDFGCALHENITKYGRMFVCENYLCFYSKFMDEPEEQLDNQLYEQQENVDVEILNIDDTKEDEKKEMLKVILPITCEQFYQYFISDNAGFSLQDNLKNHQQAYDFEPCEWSGNQEDAHQTREIKCIVKIKGVPFKDKSRLHKVQTLVKTEEGGYEMSSLTKVLDVPYSSHYQFEDKWQVIPQENNKCKLIVTTWIVIVKNFIS
ncbi:hypothetical protein PPERSA_10120 [Pseudocohnilembus persalinus]|uniref:VASt domain-containing protein n=1 Tax=Pseudocohnilembus persalinus TaxID=266149 RepID=A0A0V0QZW1_PSEPJ|nr:hypothetical protein PPERSA_10120 [Pseudocohnilembus persalinus]|eukprot:KRX07836.1 hypothetical protein PPERSA_10120 [Pseudocohnilembus persalinus]